MATYFLTDGIRTTAEWEAAASTIAVIRPELELSGWTDYLPQQGAAGNEDGYLTPDAPAVDLPAHSRTAP